MAMSKPQDCTCSGLRNVELDTIFKYTRLTMRRATSIHIMKRLMKGEGMDVSAVELDQSEAIYQLCRNTLMETLDKTKHKLMAFEKQKHDDRKGIVAVTLKKQTSSARQHPVVWAVVQMDLTTLPKVGYVKSFDITVRKHRHAATVKEQVDMIMTGIFDCLFGARKNVEHQLHTLNGKVYNLRYPGYFWTYLASGPSIPPDGWYSKKEHMTELFKGSEDSNSNDGDEYPTYDNKNLQTRSLDVKTTASAMDIIFHRDQATQMEEMKGNFDLKFPLNDSDDTLVISSDEELERSMVAFQDPDSTTV